MNRKLLLLGFVFVFAGNMLFAQQGQTAAKSRADQIHSLMDYRFRGGFYSFESLLNKTVKYTDEARANCIIGTMIAEFTVDCQGNVKKVQIKNPLGYGLQKQLSDFLTSTAGHWNECKDARFTHFVIPIQFTMEGTQTDTLNPVIVFEGENPGYACPDDSFYLRRAQEALKKGKRKKAKTYLEILVKRNPFETKYYNMLKEAIAEKAKKKKKKKK
jgi:hypothetical protein